MHYEPDMILMTALCSVIRHPAPKSRRSNHPGNSTSLSFPITFTFTFTPYLTLYLYRSHIGASIHRGVFGWVTIEHFSGTKISGARGRGRFSQAT